VNLLAAYDHDDEQAADAVVREYLPLVKRVALRLAARLPTEIELDDLMQVGLMGLLKARESYDPGQGASFATYAGIRIKGAMLDEVRAHDWLPRSVQAQLRRVADAIDAAESRLGRAPQDADIASELDVPLDEYRKVAGELACARMTHIEDSVEAGFVSGSLPTPVDELDRQAFRDALAQAVRELPERESFMMSMYYSEDMNLKEIGAVLGVSESRVSQLHGQALARLRARLAAWKA